MADVAKNLLLLFDRPNEPIFTPKGNQKKIIVVPEDYLDDRQKERKDTYTDNNRAAEAGFEKIPVPVNLFAEPDIPLASTLSKDAKFSLFIPLHQDMANEVIEFLTAMQSLEDFWSYAVYFRAKLNPLLFNYALSVSMLHYEELKDSEQYPLNALFPEKFFDGDVLQNAREEAEVNRSGASRLGDIKVEIEIERDQTATDLDLEHRLAYFREDIGVNLHHWHWHLVYPLTNKELAKKDRRGELFYYMHQQIIARYNMERFCNNLPRVKKITNLQDPIEEAYFPKITTRESRHNWAGRVANSVIRDVSHSGINLYFDVLDLERWRYRLYDAIHQGYAIDKQGERVDLKGDNGIDILGDMVESSPLSVNQDYYGHFHNMMHVAIGVIHDPDYRHKETISVIGDLATAMRDPAFYRVHMTVDDIFQTYKNTLGAYPSDQLRFSNVEVKSVSVKVEGKEDNQLFTYWKKSSANLSNGLDFLPRGSILVKFTHLQHRSFKYHIEVDNKGSTRKGTIRIFIAPKYDERKEIMDFKEQRKFFVELDRFTSNLKNGVNRIERESKDSSVTIPFERTYRDLSQAPDSAEKKDKFNFCGCGWPHNLLIAKGTETGFPCQLFVMVSNFADDKVEQKITKEDCDDAMSYCGIRNKKYPDARTMGFPFDRPPPKDTKTLDAFYTPYANMLVTEVKIFHEGDAVES